MIIIVFVILSQADCNSQGLSSWDIGIGLESYNSGILQRNLSAIVSEGAGRPELNFRDNVFHLDGSDYYQIDFTANTIDSAQWLKIGMGGYQEDRQKHENYDPESDLFFILGLDNSHQRNSLIIDGQVRLFITDMDWGIQVERLAYLRGDRTRFGISATGTNDKYIKRYGIGPIAIIDQDDYQLSLEYFIGDINWRLGGSYSF